MRAHHKFTLASVLASSLLAASVIPAVASPEVSNRNSRALVERNRDAEPAVSVDTREDAKRYAQQERSAPQAAEFNGGAAVVIIGSTAAMVLLLLLVLLVV